MPYYLYLDRKKRRPLSKAERKIIDEVIAMVKERK